MKRLETLLGPKPTHPWAALIPQLLLWSFRRFCVEKLLVPSDALLLEQVWEDHLELVRNWAPRGLEELGLAWLEPENADTLHSSLSDWNLLLLDFLELIDEAIAEEDDALQSKVSQFLDEDIATVFEQWLDGPERAFFIFPLKGVTADGEFTDQQMMALIQALREYSSRLPVVLPEQCPSEESPANSDSEEEESVEAERQPAAPPAEPEPEAPQLTPAPTTVAAAMRRRRTFRCRGPNANRAITLRRIRLRRRTKRAVAAAVAANAAPPHA